MNLCFSLPRQIQKLLVASLRNFGSATSLDSETKALGSATSVQQLLSLQQLRFRNYPVEKLTCFQILILVQKLTQVHKLNLIRKLSRFRVGGRGHAEVGLHLTSHPHTDTHQR